MAPWLLINPNTTAAVTQALLQRLHADTAAHLPAPPWQAVTAGFGAPYIADERGYCIAGHAVLEAWDRAQAIAPAGGFGGVLVGCFGDPGLEALRASTTVPVWGLAEASLQALWQRGPARVAIVTGGVAWRPMLQRWSRAQGYDRAAAEGGHCISAIDVLAASAGQMMASPEAAALALSVACQEALACGHSDAVLLGGAGLAGMGERVRTITGAPVWDCVELVQARWRALGQGHPRCASA